MDVESFIKEKHGGKDLQTFLHALPAGMTDQVQVSYFEEATPTAHWHYITSSFSEFGFELSLRLTKKDEATAPEWPVRMFNEFLAYTRSSGQPFTDNDFMEYTNGPLDADIKTDMTGAVFVKDPELGVLEGSNGPVLFLQVFPLFADELTEVQGANFMEFIEKLKATIPSLVLDLSRASILKV